MARKLCTVCNIRVQYTGPGDELAPRLSGRCNPCYTEGGWINSHSDNGHEDINSMSVLERMSAEGQQRIREKDDCWVCYPELNLAKKSHTPRATGTRKQSTRRAQLNHKGHSHPQTPAARRACKDLFWLKVGELTKETTASVMQRFGCSWDTRFDGKVAIQLQPTERQAK